MPEEFDTIVTPDTILRGRRLFSSLQCRGHQSDDDLVGQRARGQRSQLFSKIERQRKHRREYQSHGIVFWRMLTSSDPPIAVFATVIPTRRNPASPASLSSFCIVEVLEVASNRYCILFPA